MEMLIFLIGLAVVTWVAGNARGRFGFGYFLLSFVISPIICLLLILVLPRKDNPNKVGRIRIER